MAQASDYTVNNSTGANVRQDINTIFEAIATNNSGGSAPNNTKPTQFFADTTASMLKLRNTSNNGYVNFRKLDGKLPLPDGTKTACALFFDDDTNTGIFSGGADEINISTGGEERFVINSSGNCGIGVESPSDILSVAKSHSTAYSASSVQSGGARLSIFNINNTTSNTFADIHFKCHSTSSGEARIGMRMPSVSNSELFFITENSGTLGERMTINSSGNVGIGTTSPASKLHVVDSISGGGDGVITATDSGSNDFGVGLAIRKTTTTTSSSQRFIQFFVNGVTQPMGGIVGNGAEQAQFLQLSDERCKKNIKPLSGILDKVNKLKTVSFDWKHINESVEAGFIAQNVQELFPEYVIKNIANEGEEEKMGTTGGMTGGFIAVLTAAIQELSAKVEALEAR